jgi:hypothetical protein
MLQTSYDLFGISELLDEGIEKLASVADVVVGTLKKNGCWAKLE